MSSIYSSSVEKHFIHLLGCNNPSGQEDEIRNYIRDQLKSWGVLDNPENSLVQDEIGNLYFRLVGEPSLTPRLFCAHMDSVPPCVDISYKQYKDENGEQCVQADGKTVLGADDRAGIAVMMTLIETYADLIKPKPTLEFLFTAQEEVGIKGARVFDTSLLLSKDVYVLDGEGAVGIVFNQGPARSILQLELIGKPSHAGISPEKGINAIMAAGQLLAMFPSSGRLSAETTWNLGKITGGKALNVVADYCLIEAEFRSQTQEGLEDLIQQIKEAIAQFLIKWPELKINQNWQLQYPAFTVNPELPVVKTSLLAAEKANLKAKIEPMAIGSDAHILNQKDLNAVVWGMGFTGSHSTAEKITIEDLNRVVVWATALINLD